MTDQPSLSAIARRIARLYRVPLKFVEGKHPVAIPASKKGRRRGW